MEMKLADAGYARVQLTDSPFAKQRAETIETYLDQPRTEDILHRLRLRCGLPSSARGMTGWGPSIGQYLGAFAKLYRATGDERLKQKCLDLFEGWRACADHSDAALHLGTYPYEKMLGGLLDMYEYLGMEAVVPYIRRLTECARQDFDPEIPRDGVQDAGMKGQIEWYTLPENLFRAYMLLGDELYLDFGMTWLYPYCWDRLAQGDDRIGPRHAYSHVNSLSSAARTYMVTGDAHYLDVIREAYRILMQKHTYATGGYGPAETLFGEDSGYLGNALLSTWDRAFHDGEGIVYTNFARGRVARSDAWGSCEVSCCAWAVFKLCNYLLKLTGEARYAEWAEKMLVNGTLGQLPITRKGQVLYYASYFADGALKSYEDRRLQHLGQNFVWQCCTGTFPQDVAEYSNMVAYYDARGVYVSQLIPARIQVETPAGHAAVESCSDFPMQQEARFVVHAPSPVKFALRVRIPAWAGDGRAVWLNGQALDMDLPRSDWMALERVWADGDEVVLKLPFQLHFESVDAQHPELAALVWGPMVLCTDEMTLLVGDREHPEAWIRPVEGEEGVFETLPGHTGIYEFVTRTFRPYWKVPAMQWYYMYHRLYPDMDAVDREHQGF